MNWKRSVFSFAAAVILAVPALADSVSLGPAKDNTLIQRTDPNAQFSNGLGDISAGRTGQDGQGPATLSIRRGLVQFDVAANIPFGSIITGATLTLRETTGQNGDPAVRLHRLLQDWGEGSSFQPGGQGAAATQNDATWLYTFYDAGNPAASPTWNTPGGDYEVAWSASAIVSDDQGGGQSFSWSGAGLIADVQDFLDNPAANFGWILIGDESIGGSAKRFNSSESGIAPNVVPELLISYVIPEPSSAVLLVVAAACVSGWRLRRRGGR